MQIKLEFTENFFESKLDNFLVGLFYGTVTEVNIHYQRLNRIIVDRVNIFDPNFREHENQNMEESKEPQKNIPDPAKMSKSKKSVKKV